MVRPKPASEVLVDRHGRNSQNEAGMAQKSGAKTKQARAAERWFNGDSGEGS